MCTTVAIGGKRLLFGRNMDIAQGFGERIIAVPRAFPLSFRCGAREERHYAMIGVGTVRDGYPLYADGVNEHGLAAAGLRFRYSVHYADPGRIGGDTPLAPHEVIPFLLAYCRSVDEARDRLSRCRVVNVPFSDALGIAPLHWHIADRSGSLVLESTADGMRIYDDPTGVLTNEPPFPSQLAHLSCYTHLSCTAARGTLGDLTPCSLGTGAVGLPGDYSSPSRFVRAAFLRAAFLRAALCRAETDGRETVRSDDLFRILFAVAPLVGTVEEETGDLHRTVYSSVMDGEAGSYRVVTESSLRIEEFGLRDIDREGRELWIRPLCEPV